MSKHTPGPWDFDTDDLGTWINSSAFPQPIAKMGKCTSFPTEANARLIAAAPDLLAALKLAVEKTVGSDPKHPWIHFARGAIAKAEGAS